MGRSTQGVKFVSPKGEDAVAVVARSVEVAVVEEDSENGAQNGAPATEGSVEESPSVAPGATIDESGASPAPDDSESEAAPQED